MTIPSETQRLVWEDVPDLSLTELPPYLLELKSADNSRYGDLPFTKTEVMIKLLKKIRDLYYDFKLTEKESSSPEVPETLQKLREAACYIAAATLPPPLPLTNLLGEKPCEQMELIKAGIRALVLIGGKDATQIIDHCMDIADLAAQKIKPGEPMPQNLADFLSLIPSSMERKSTRAA